MTYRVNETVEIDCGFELVGQTLAEAAHQTNDTLRVLPANFFRSIDFKTTSAVIGALYCEELANLSDGFVNPIEKGHPDIIPIDGIGLTEEELRNYPIGIEVKCTIGSVEYGANLRAGAPRIDRLTGITWQAHHQEVKELIGLVWDFVESDKSFNFPRITGIFYSKELVADDWGKISGTTGRNTKVTGMLTSGKRKMGQGWVAVLDNLKYVGKYEAILNFMASVD